MNIDYLINKMYDRYWHGHLSILERKVHLSEGLVMLESGDWVGSSMHSIAVKGGFIIDGESMKNKELTALGLWLVDDMRGSDE